MKYMVEPSDMEFASLPSATQQYIWSLQDNLLDLEKALMLLADPEHQLEITRGGLYIFRLELKDVEQIASALFINPQPIPTKHTLFDWIRKETK